MQKYPGKKKHSRKKKHPREPYVPRKKKGGNFRYFALLTIAIVSIFFQSYFWFHIVEAVIGALVLISIVGYYAFYRKGTAILIRTIIVAVGSGLFYFLFVLAAPYMEDIPAYEHHQMLYVQGVPSYIEKVHRQRSQDIIIDDVQLINYTTFIDPVKKDGHYFVFAYLPHSHFVLDYNEVQGEDE